MPKISVIVPVYKVEPYLHRCVDSILNQTFQDFELILVDDGSPDNCPQICDEYAQKDNRVFVIHKENGGLSDARNKGIDWAFENSDSEWITFIDSDDWVHAQYLELLYKGVIESGCKISACSLYYTKGELPEEKDTEMKLLSPEDFWVTPGSNAVIACCKLYRKELWSKNRFPIGKINEDAYIVYKILFNKRELIYIPKELYYYYENPSSIMRRLWKPERINAIIAKKKQVRFFKAKRLKKAYKRAHADLIKLYIQNIEQALYAQKTNEYAKEIKKMRKGLGVNLLRFRKYMPIRHYDDLYLIAYPKRKKLIKFLKRLDSKVSRMFHKGQEV